MQLLSIIPTVVTFIGVVSFAVLFTILYRAYTKSQIEEITSGKRDIEIIDEVIHNRQESVIKRKKRVKIIKLVAYYTAAVIIVPLFVFSLYSKIVNNVLMIGGKTYMVVATPSMSEVNEINKYIVQYNLTDQFGQYSIINLEKVESPTEINKYDIICFKNNKDVNIIHRIRDIRIVNGEVRYITRGDANNSDDVYQPRFEDIVGIYTGNKVDGIGIFIIFLQSGSGIITLFALIYCIIMIDQYAEKIEKIQKERALKLAKVIDYSEEKESKALTAKYHETIYYKGDAYLFDENGFIEKKEKIEQMSNEETQITVEESTEKINEEEKEGE